ncbi:leucine-rich repeat domain-containing protein [Turneriella parva]|uniref:Leucine-rich repeat-containing protein n=1 Tax=Turneriella parva (strain ATCC BAA-1111 / DSM 21527 / NCTC 11395 / H) TaxID=869212 RepID=I4B680_TURPD|nr:leucine-rich repeat domain-containing protein [Turneriella parva]AFM12787.1 leucine-rich repeat-containing protein [Turneriella parva DSM 21527]
METMITPKRVTATQKDWLRFGLEMIPDAIMLLFIGWGVPAIIGRLRLFEYFRVSMAVFVSLTALLSLAEVIALVYFLKHYLWWHRQQGNIVSGSKFLAVMALARVFPTLMPAMAIGEAFGSFRWGVMYAAFAALAGFFFCGLLSDPAEFLESRQLRRPHLLLVHLLLFANMCCLCVLGFALLDGVGDLDIIRALSETPSDVPLILIVMLFFYFPVRIYEMLDDGLISRSGIPRIWYGLRMVVVFLLVVWETGSQVPSVIDTALDSIDKPLRVTHLDLTRSDLSRIAEISKFESIRHLSLAANRLTEVPEGVWKLKSLETLDLRRNQLTRISPDITGLQKLTVLKISHNNLASLPEALLLLPLRKVEAEGNPWNGLSERIEQRFAEEPAWQK